MPGANPAHGTAAVVRFAPRPAGHDSDHAAALQVTAACPGWWAWRSRRDGQWHARRTIGSCQNLDDGRAYLVSAPDLPGLLTAIGQQALLDIAAEYPDWDVAQTDTGRWWAVRNGAAAGRTSLIRADTPMALLSALRSLEACRLPRPPRGAA
jgi:hypothetical protein